MIQFKKKTFTQKCTKHNEIGELLFYRDSEEIESADMVVSVLS